MKSLRCLFLSLIALAVSALAQQGAPALPATLLNKPFHVGDDTNKEMASPKPNGPKFTGKFALPENVKVGLTTAVYVNIRVGGLIPAADKHHDKEFKKGQMLTKLLVNGMEVAVLNKLMHGADAVSNIQKLQGKVESSFLRAGVNELEIRPGATANNADDFELHEVTVSSTP